MNKNDGTNNKRALENTLERLYAVKRKTPWSFFVLLLLLYFIANFTVSNSAGSSTNINIMGYPIPLYTFAGVFSSLSNICILLIAMYFDKIGFITSIFLLTIQIPVITSSIIFRKNLTSLPGVFGNLLAIVAVILIYLNNKKIKDYNKKLRDQALMDILTGLPNRFANLELITELIKREIPFVAVSIDINGFNSINETMGYDIGNKTLIEIANRWKKIADGGLSGTLDFLARHGGDEFALVIRNYNSEEDIVKTIKMYEDALKEHLTISDFEFYVSASFGYAIYPDDAADIDSVFLYADMAMQEVKHNSSSNHIIKFTKDLKKEERTLQIEGKIRDAIENDTLFFNLQPQYDMNHKLRGFEVLARMKDEDGTYISPVEFIPIAEKVGLIDKLDSIVYNKSAFFIGDMLKRTGMDIMLSINVSVKHLMKSDFSNEIKNLLDSSGIPPRLLEIEITESIMIESMDKAMNCIKEIKDLGVQIAIDDFGTGYSSLSYLNNFPASLLKIDKSFIDKMNMGDKSKQYVAAIISLGHIMGFNVISEGVEESDQIETLREIGCDYIQGYIWGKPLPQEEAEKLIMSTYKID